MHIYGDVKKPTRAGYQGYPLHLAQTRSNGFSWVVMSWAIDRRRPPCATITIQTSPHSSDTNASATVPAIWYTTIFIQYKNAEHNRPGSRLEVDLNDPSRLKSLLSTVKSVLPGTVCFVWSRLHDEKHVSCTWCSPPLLLILLIFTLIV